ncbi:unnamed protein product [Miscanthus lutarioriparius]|uniref:Plant heme peroxidase family profile domain-containing protein n=1 Tax=Miscanthus lutarioriparius TaxID=422564 RepID=A0A811RU17_9POAL|nr:unnamed protein product [Miscanthus lutarioriparius]
MMKVSVPAAVLALCAAALLLLAQAPSAAEASHHLKLGYYKETCPGVEKIVKYHVAKAIKANRGAGAALVRLIFHDCFVRIVPAYRNLLSAKCGAGPDPVVPNNVRDEDPRAVAASFPSFLKKLRKAREFLDNSYYHNNLARIVTFNSDWQLLTEKEALGHVKEYAENGTLWDEDFSDALVKLSKLPMPPHSKGEIRKTCRWVNHDH